MANEPLIPNVPFMPRDPADADDLLRWAKETQAATRENYRVLQKRLEELNLTRIFAREDAEAHPASISTNGPCTTPAVHHC